MGASNLLLTGVIARPTKDGDLLAERTESGNIVPMTQMPDELSKAVLEVAAAYGLADGWLNLGPAALMDIGLPSGFAERLAPTRFGTLTLWLAGRYDMVCFKLYAAADQRPTRGRHLQDLQHLAPSEPELAEAANWCRSQDPSRGFALLLEPVLHALGAEVDHG